MEPTPSSNLPKDFTHLFQDRLFLEGMSSARNYSIVGEDGNLGRRYTIGPLCVEYYTGDKEPILTPLRGFRFVIWNPVTRDSATEGWFSFKKESRQAVSVYVDIRDAATYPKRWSDTFTTYQNRFLKQGTYRVIEVSCEKYCNLYMLYAKKNIFNTKNIAQAKKLFKKDKTATHFYSLEEMESGVILGGIATVDCLSVDQSYYLSAFTRKDIAPKETGFWLCSYWMRESNKRGIAFANLGLMWRKGDPLEWKGFSDFKMKFSPEYIVPKKERMKVTWSFFK